MPIDSRQHVLHAVTESSPGTPESITVGTTVAIPTVGPVGFEPIGTQLIERGDVMTSRGGSLAPALGSQGWRVTFQTELYPWDDLEDDTSSPLAALWAACGKLEELTTPDRIRWTPKAGNAVGTDFDPCTIYLDEIGGNRKRAHYCAGRVTAEADAGGRVLLSWEFLGRWTTPTASVVTAGSETYGSSYPVPAVFRPAITLTSGIAGTVSGLARFALDDGVALVERQIATAAGAMDVAYRQRSEVGPVLSIDIDADDESTLSAWAEAVGLTVEARSLVLTDSAGDSCTISLPSSFVRLPQMIDGEAYRGYTIEMVGTTQGANSAVDPLTITWEAV